MKREGALIAAARRHDAAHVGFISGFRWPVAGRVTGVFGSRRILNGAPGSRHRGVDIAAPAGTPVLAAADGRVAMAHPGMVLTGSTVMLDHGHGLMSVYAHLDAIRVRAGDAVARGGVIGTVGMTGRATAPHLHWGVSWFSTHLDPALLAGPMVLREEPEPDKPQ